MRQSEIIQALSMAHTPKRTVDIDAAELAKALALELAGHSVLDPSIAASAGGVDSSVA